MRIFSMIEGKKIKKLLEKLKSENLHVYLHFQDLEVMFIKVKRNNFCVDTFPTLC